MTIKFARRTDVMPPVPIETKHHPSSVDLLLIKCLIFETSKQNLLQFLQHEVVNVGKSYAERLIGQCMPYLLRQFNSSKCLCPVIFLDIFLFLLLCISQFHWDDIHPFSGEMGPDFSPKMAVKSLTDQQIVRIHQLFRQAKFDDPSGEVCYPLSSLLSSAFCPLFL